MDIEKNSLVAFSALKSRCPASLPNHANGAPHSICASANAMHHHSAGFVPKSALAIAPRGVVRPILRPSRSLVRPLALVVAVARSRALSLAVVLLARVMSRARRRTTWRSVARAVWSRARCDDRVRFSRASSRRRAAVRDARERHDRARRARARARASATRGRRAGDGMVLYDAMIVVSAKVPKTACADVLRRLGASVMDAGGVVTNVASYGARTLAYEFRRPGEKHFEVRRRRSERSRGFARRDANANRTRTSSTRACEHR
jgi:hypothetical protein